MKVLPIDPTENASPEALLGFLAQCQAAAQSDGRSRLVSISITVGGLDPLAVLEAIYEPGHPHFYAEHPSDATAIAGAETAESFTAEGPQRFSELQGFVDDVLERAIAVGAVDAPFGGPHFFVGASFASRSEPGDAFPALTAFVPQWQVARAGDRTTAVANLLVAADSELPELAERVLRAHGRFHRISYGNESTTSPVGETPAINHHETGDYEAKVATALQRIEAGEFTKIVLARAVDLKASTPLHPLLALDGLRQRFPECFSFSIANGRGDSFIGASPERLVRVSQGVLEADVLAGSIRRGRGAAEDAALGQALLNSAKDLHEHAVVLRMVQDRLAELGLDLEHGEIPGLRKLANVQHLYTPVRGQMREGVKLLDVVDRLHPTPAVGGEPREATGDAIREIEGFSRGLYAGALGWINSRGGGEFMVGIRSALVRGADARVFAGAGIVAGSTPTKELAETDLKFKALLEGLIPPA